MKVEKIQYAIAIIGYGFVGQAVHSACTEEVLIIDPDKGYHVIGSESAENVFICVGTPMSEDGSQIMTQVEEAIKIALDLSPDLIIIKSTVNPSYMNQLRMQALQQLIVFNPEFLNQNSFAKDFKHQKLCVIGGEMGACKRLMNVYDKFFDVTIDDFELCTHEQAMIIKYIHNAYNAYKVLFWNYVNEMTGDHRIYARAYKALRKDLDSEFTNVAADGKPGYGGACFPKDVSAMHHNVFGRHELTEYMIMYNNRIRPGLLL